MGRLRWTSSEYADVYGLCTGDEIDVVAQKLLIIRSYEGELWPSGILRSCVLADGSLALQRHPNGYTGRSATL